jgi:hypothetical protein
MDASRAQEFVRTSSASEPPARELSYDVSRPASSSQAHEAVQDASAAAASIDCIVSRYRTTQNLGRRNRFQPAAGGEQGSPRVTLRPLAPLGVCETGLQGQWN